MTRTFYLILFVSCFVSYSIYSQGKITNNNKYKTWISTVKEGELLKVNANFRNNTDNNITISYSMISNKSGKDGNSLTTQKGTVKMNGNKSSVLARCNINLSKNDIYSFILTTYKDTEVIGKDSVLYHQK